LLRDFIGQLEHVLGAPNIARLPIGSSDQRMSATMYVLP